MLIPARLGRPGRDDSGASLTGQLVYYRQEADAIVARGAWHMPRQMKSEVKRESRYCLGLDRDLTAFYDFAAGDHIAMAAWLKPLVGLPDILQRDGLRGA